MKKFIFLLAVTSLAFSHASAQSQDQLFYAKLKKDKVPTEVVTAVTEDLEDGIVVTDYYAIPVELIEDNWVITYNPENKDLKDLDYYSYDVKFSGPNVAGEAVYDANGDLVSFIEQVKNAPIPRHIQRSINEEFPGWMASNDHETITVNRHEQKKTYYKVQLIKGHEKQKVVFNGDGNLVRVGKEHRTLFNQSRHNNGMNS